MVCEDGGGDVFYHIGAIVQMVSNDMAQCRKSKCNWNAVGNEQ